MASATGTANCGGSAVPKANDVEYRAVIRPILSGKYFLTSGGSSTFPAPRPANATTVRIMNGTVSETSARAIWPSTADAMAIPRSFSRLAQRTTYGVIKPKTAKVAVGNVPSRPIMAAERAISSPIWLISGETAVTAMRSVIPKSRMPASTIIRPRKRPGSPIGRLEIDDGDTVRAYSRGSGQLKCCTCAINRKAAAKDGWVLPGRGQKKRLSNHFGHGVWQPDEIGKVFQWFCAHNIHQHRVLVTKLVRSLGVAGHLLKGKRHVFFNPFHHPRRRR